MFSMMQLDGFWVSGFNKENVQGFLVTQYAAVTQKMSNFAIL